MNATVVKSKVRYVQSLSQKKVRDDEGVFVAEGPKIINELLGEPAIQLVELFAKREWINENDPTSAAPVEVDDVMLSRLSHLSTPNQVLGIFRIPHQRDFVARGMVSLLLYNIQDPGNLGSIIRCADWFGVRQVVCSPDSADVFSPKAVQSTMGSIARVSVFYADPGRILGETRNIPVYAAALSGENISQMEPIDEGIIMIGNESRGLSEELLRLATKKITIPKKGGAESLNAAVATGIILSHLVK